MLEIFTVVFRFERKGGSADMCPHCLLLTSMVIGIVFTIMLKFLY
jgi:multisubunit Na+/H+ antiporter MnhC subunit